MLRSELDEEQEVMEEVKAVANFMSLARGQKKIWMFYGLRDDVSDASPDSIPPPLPLAPAVAHRLLLDAQGA